MLDKELFGLWSADALYSPGAQSDDWLIFKPDGTGRYEFLNWGLCAADLFRWDTPRPGILRIVGERRLKPPEGKAKAEEWPSLFGTREVAYTITDEDTPSGKRMHVLRCPLERPMEDCFGFSRADLSG